MRRVVVTGIGLVTPLGTGVESVWSKLIAGQCGIRKIEHFDTSDLASKIAGIVPQVSEVEGAAQIGEVNDSSILNLDQVVSPKDRRKMDDFIVYALAAAEQAITDSGWQPQQEHEFERTGVMVGSGIGGLKRIYETSVVLHEQGARRISPFFIPSCLINLASGHISIQYGFKGPNHAVVTACSTGAHAIGDAARLIKNDEADVMIAGGTEASICRIGIAGFAASRALSTGFNDSPTHASRPWDKDRDGFVMGEGAGIVVLEELEHAKKRGVPIYGEVLGYGLSGDAFHMTAPPEDGNGGYRAMALALKQSGLGIEDIGYINAHGTSTPVGDSIELGAIKRLFEPSLAKLSVSSTKSAIGHLLGAAGSVEAIFSLLSLKHQILPPTLNLHQPSQGCEGVDLVPLQAKEKKIQYAMSNAFGFGGTNTSLIFGAL